jgi:excisionase family DNA binding protein
MTKAEVERRARQRLMDLQMLEAESGISRHTWRSWIQARRIPFVRLGRRTLLERETFEKLIQAGRVEARPQ